MHYVHLVQCTVVVLYKTHFPNFQFAAKGLKYSVCLCKSARCSVASINSTTERGETTKLGTLSASSLMLSSVTGGPRLTFTGGDSCSGGEQDVCIFVDPLLRRYNYRE